MTNDNSNYQFLSQDRSRNREVLVMQQVNPIEASQHLAELIEAAMRGEEVIITKDERSVVKLVPLPTEKKHYPAKAGTAIGLVTVAEDFDEPLEDFKDYM
jgi:antitoxin (DNA-binding transcriptional repressor) of toxin-antitoxin stability system